MTRRTTQKTLLNQRNETKAPARDLKATDRVYDQISPNLLPLVSARYV